MAVTVCTGWHPPAWEHYARQFVETFAEHWPAEVGLVTYTEEPVDLVRGECRNLWGISGAHDFVARHSAIPTHCGNHPTPYWRPKDLRIWKATGERAWRWDALRFFKQCIIPEAAAASLPDGDILIWLDADIVTIADVPARLFDDLLGRSDLCYLGRNKGAEIGFWAVRLSPESRCFLADLSGMYLEDRAFGLPQWHSAFVFDHCRQVAQRRGLDAKDLTPWGRDHVFVHQNSPIMPYLDHKKGPRRKNLGYSPEHPLRWWERKA